MMVVELLDDAEVQKYVKSKEFCEGKIQVETAMCDNFKGWGNFTINELGIISNVCHPHASGKVHFTCQLICYADVWARQVLRPTTVRMSSTFRTSKRTMTTMTLWSTLAMLECQNLQIGFRTCLSIISA